MSSPLLTIEDLAVRVVNIITECIDQLREIEEFNKVTNVVRSSSRTSQAATSCSSVPFVFSRLISGSSSRSSNSNNLITKVQEVVADVAKELRVHATNNSEQTVFPWTTPSDDNVISRDDDDDDDDDNHNSDERWMLVHRILLPLLMSLAQCYAVLDQLPIDTHAVPMDATTEAQTATPATSTITTQQQQQQQETKPNNNNNHRHRRGRQKPPAPPIGMLSLRNYTDIACLVEWTICTSVLPLLDPFVLLNVDERVRYLLPKSLAGRIPRKALQWGCSYYRYASAFASDDCGNTDTDIINNNNNKSQQAQELQTTARVLEKLILLDRFRPMLLPRHLADLYAAILQAQALVGEEVSSIKLSASYKSIDPVLQAKAYQTLLLQGTQAPVWLRKRVSQLLMELATKQDLLAIIQVFVHAAPNKDRTAAGLRLARALKSGIKNNNNDHHHHDDDDDDDKRVQCLCQQVISILQGIWNEHGSLQALLESPSFNQKEATIHTLWAILDILPPNARDLFFERWMSHWVVMGSSSPHNKSTSDIYQTVGLVGTLLSTVPPLSDTSFVLRLILNPLGDNRKELATDGLPTTLLGMWLRLARMACVTRSQIKQDTILLLRLLIKTIVESKSVMKDDCGNVVRGIDLAAVSLLFALGPCQWDVTPVRFQRVIDGDGEEELVSIERISDNRSLVEIIVQEMEQRTRVLSKVILPARDCDDNSATQKLPSLLFALMLRLYFSINSENETEPKVPELFRSAHFQLLPLVCLPVMCEENQVTSLLSADSERDGLFEMMGLIFQATAKLVVSQEDALATLQTTTKNSVAFCKRIDLAADFISELVGNNLQQPKAQTLFEDFGTRSGNEDVLFSISSALLGILISILELGAKRRSHSDEEAFKSFVPYLQQLSEISAKVPTEDLHLTESALSEFAEMASLANALIASRAVLEVEMESDQKAKTREEMLAQAQNDLKSKDPPIRARGVVQLRHLAVAATADCVSLVQPIESDSILHRLLSVSLEALRDKESYVYLAAIHTISAIADALPSEIVPLLGRILATSRFSFSAGSDILLDNEQRIKLAEALIFAVRRRGSIHEYIPFLLECMLFGPGNNKALVSPDTNEANLIQRHTHDYFMKGRASDVDDNEDNDEGEDTSKKWEEIDIRVNAGGPLFETEEDDAVCASQLNVVAELLSVSDPSTVSRFTSFILDASLNGLRLDSSRPVRRAGAYLARQLYSALLREEAALGSDNANLSYAISLADGGEDMLRAVLQRCCKGEDLNDLGGAMHRAYDPATVARCEEALDLRKQAEDSGFLLASKLAAETQRQQSKNPIARLLGNKHSAEIGVSSARFNEMIEEMD